MEQLEILGLKVTSATKLEINDVIDSIIAHGGKGFVLSVNVHAVNLARSRPWLIEFFKKADIGHVDGAGIILAAQWLGHHIPERLTWADWAKTLAEHFSKKGYRLFMLGGPNGLTAKAADIAPKTARAVIIGNIFFIFPPYLFGLG